jgi:peptidoglycan/xylan/chitin deacetylase (PgdA/CDA1 family)
MTNSNYNKIALTVDIEDWYHTPAITGSDFSFYRDVPTFMRSWHQRYDYLTKPTIRVLSLLEEFDLKATFFIIADIIEYYPGLVERIVEMGHEIGCHGLHHALKIDTKNKRPLFSISEFEDRTFQAREMLRKISYQEVKGYRAPGAYIGEWMFESLIKLGFKYDSSVNPNSFFNKTDFDNMKISSKPYKIGVDGFNDYLIEIPWPYFKIGEIKFPTAGGPFFRFFPLRYMIKGLEDSLKRGDTVFYLHSIDISDEKLPEIASRNKRRPFYFLTNGRKTFAKLKKLLKHLKRHWVTCSNLNDNFRAN